MNRMYLVICLMCLLMMMSGIATAQPDGLTSHWPLDGDLADSVGGIGATVTGGAPAFVEGQVGSAGLRFNGQDDVVELELVADPAAYTITLWVNAERTDNASLVVRTSGSGTTTHWSHQLRIHDGVFHHYLWVGAQRHVMGVTPVEPGTWYHVAIVGQDNGPMHLYVDGMEEGDSIDTAGTLWRDGDRYHVGSNSGHGMGFYQGVIDDVQFYDRVLSGEEIQFVMRSGLHPERASDPIPANEAVDVPRHTTLDWTPGDFAAAHTVYLSTSFADVNEGRPVARISEGAADPSAQPGPLAFGETYYWRVDEVNGAPDFTVFEGAVWSFTVEPFSIPIGDITVTASSAFGVSVPENTINGSGMVGDLHGTAAGDMWISGGVPASIEYTFAGPQKLHELWIWNSNQLIEAFVGFGAKDVVIEFSVDGKTWQVLEGVGPLTQGPGSEGYAHKNIIDFGGVMASHVRLTIDSVHGIAPQASLSEVRFFSIPVYAREPVPADGGRAESVTTTLSWRSGREAVDHEVLLSTDKAVVADGSVPAVVTQESTLTPAPLTYGDTYYWQVIESNAVGVPPRHAGPIWSFRAPEHLVIDDFESYADEEFKEIWATWIDGFDDPGNGGLVGNGNGGEATIVHEGQQSMPIHYDNSTAPISAVTRTFEPALDWTIGSPTSLTLHVRGNAAAFAEDAEGNITLSGAGADIWNTSDEFRFAYKSLSGDGSISARVHSHTEVHNWSKVGVMIRESTAPESSMFMLPITGVNGVRPQGRSATFAAAVNMPGGLDGTQENIARDQPVWLMIERKGDAFSGYYSTEETVTNWTPLPGNPWTLPMAANTLIGLAATSHSPGNTMVAYMSDVSTTGNVGGEWTVEAIGVEQPSNDGDAIFATITDRSGRSATVSYLGGDSTATLSTVFDQWTIPLSALGSVSLTSIESIGIGVGTPGGVPNGAQGTVYVDLLQVGTPLP